MSSFEQTKISLCCINFCSNSWWNQSVFACVHSFRLCHKLWILHHPRQLGQQLAAAKLCHHWHRKLPVLHQSVLLLPVRACVNLWCNNLSVFETQNPVHIHVLCRFLEQQFPQRSKFLRTGAFVLPFLFDSVPLFYRVSVDGQLISALADTEFTPRTVWLSPL